MLAQVAKIVLTGKLVLMDYVRSAQQASSKMMRKLLVKHAQAVELGLMMAPAVSSAVSFAKDSLYQMMIAPHASVSQAPTIASKLDPVKMVCCFSTLPNFWFLI